MVKRNDAYTVCALARATREPVENYTVTLVRWKPNVGSQDQQFIPSKHEYGSYLDVLCFVEVEFQHSVSRAYFFHVSKMFSTENLVSWNQNSDRNAETQSVVSRTHDLCVVCPLSLFIAGIIFMNYFYRTCINKNRNKFSTNLFMHYSILVNCVAVLSKLHYSYLSDQVKLVVFRS
jgi:hypothetical protein